MSIDAQFDAIEQEIEAIQDGLETCRRAIVASRAAIWLGGLTIVLALTVISALLTPIVLFAAITAMIGGTVWFGANKSTREELQSRLASVNQRKAQLFDVVAARNGWRDMTSTIH